MRKELSKAKKGRLALLAVMLTSLLLSACSDSATPTVSLSSPSSSNGSSVASSQVSPGAGSVGAGPTGGEVGAGTQTTEGGPRLWLISDVPGLLKNLPPAGPVLLAPLPADQEVQKRWMQPVDAWIQLELELIKNYWSTPTQAARSLAYTAISLNDALIVLSQARQSGFDASENALLATVIQDFLVYDRPTLLQRLDGSFTAATWTGVWQGREKPAQVEVGKRLGHAISQRILAYARQDKSDIGSLMTVPAAAAGVWQPTLPFEDQPLETNWGDVRLFSLPPDTNLMLEPPPAWNSPEFDKQRKIFRQSQQNLSEADRQLARKWAGGTGSVTPAGLWFQLARELILRDKLDEQGSAAVYAALGATLHNAFVATWKNKYYYWEARPIQWLGEVDKEWKPTVQTPPFPAYPSGHATVSAAASVALSAFFPQDAARLNQQAKDAAYSRLVGGIHWQNDNQKGLELGQRIGNLMLKSIKP